MKLLMILLLFYHARDTYTYQCDVKPKGASGTPNENDAKFRIGIVTATEKYIPGEVYNVTLKGFNSVMEERFQFNGFSITVQPSNTDEISPILDPQIAGILEVFSEDSSAKVDEKCPNMVIHTSHKFIHEVIVQWKAPPAGRGCMIFRASVMEQNVWYRNNRGLRAEICEDDNVKNDGNIEECEACQEAKYELKFEGMWTRQSHPLYFPSNIWSTRFSDVIGASHGVSYTFWKENEMPSQGLIEFLNNETTTTLESEIKSSVTRTVIKAKGLRYPNITGKTFAVFRVDKEKHLLSVVSLIIPSPDWFVGVSNLELCNKTEWIPYKRVDLHPFDLGLYADLQYTSKTQPTNDTITKIDHATEYASPFHTNNTERLKPLARIHLTRTRIYEKNCNEGTTNAVPIDTGGCVDDSCRHATVSNEMLNSCNFDANVDWSGCSIPQCDHERVKGKFPDWSNDVIKQCSESNKITEKLKSDGCSVDCVSKEEERLNQERRKLAAQCPTTQWGLFSACNPETCWRSRNRTLTRPEDRRNFNCAKIIFEQIIKCEGCVTNKQKASK